MAKQSNPPWSVPEPIQQAVTDPTLLHSVTGAQLMALLAEHQSRTHESLLLYEPSKIHDLFHRSKATERVLRGGNRAGKTTPVMVELARAVTGQDPYNKYPKTNGRVFLIGAKLQHLADVFYEKLFKSRAFKMIPDPKTGKMRNYRPWEDGWKNPNAVWAPALIPDRFVKDMVFETKARKTLLYVSFTTGWEIMCFSSEADPPVGTDVDLVVIDEDVKNPEWVPEMQARILDREGRLIWSTLPYSRNSILRDMCRRAKEEMAEHPDNPYIEEFVLRMRDNPYLSPEAKLTFQKQLADNGYALENRDLGEFATNHFLVWPNFDIRIHGLDLKKPERLGVFDERDMSTLFPGGQVPHDWARYMIVDPGRQVCAVLFAVVPPPRLHLDMVLIEGELYLKACTADMFGKAVARYLEHKCLMASIIDTHGSRVHDPGTGVTTEQQYSRALKAYNVKAQLTGHGFIAGYDVIEAREHMVSSWLAIREDGTTKLRIVEGACPKFEWEIQDFKRQTDAKGIIKDQGDYRHNAHLMACFDTETEVLTDSGWRSFASLDGSEGLATVNLPTNELEFQQPIGLIQKEYVGDMVRLGGRKMNGLVTADHRMVVYRRGQEEPSFREAGDLRIADSIKLHAKWSGEPWGDRPYLVPRALHAHELEKEVDPYDFAEFLGWYIAEGSCAQKIKCPGKGYNVTVSQKKPVGRLILGMLLDKLPWNWCLTKCGFETSSKSLWSYLHPLGNTYTKRVPDWIKRAEPEIIRRFLIGAILGDGHQQESIRTYYTSSPGLSDDIQELFIKSGKSAAIHNRGKGELGTVDNFAIREWRHSVGGLRDSKQMPNFAIERYEGQVFCATVPNGTLLVRRNGRPMIAGNCVGYLAAYDPKWRRPNKSLLQDERSRREKAALAQANEGQPKKRNTVNLAPQGARRA